MQHRALEKNKHCLNLIILFSYDAVEPLLLAGMIRSPFSAFKSHTVKLLHLVSLLSGSS